MFRTTFTIATFAASFGGAALAADLPRRNAAPLAPPVSASCLETNALPTDAFGFTTGSDVTDVGAFGGTLTAGGVATSRSTRLTGVTGTAQVATGLFRCFEIGPYLYLGGSSAKSFGLSGDTTVYGGGVEMKYKFLGRDVHGVGATADVDFSVGGNRFSGALFGGATTSFTNYTVAARLFLDREFIKDRLYGALNFEHVSTYARLAGVSLDSSAFNVRAALSVKAAPNFFVGGEAWYSRAYAGAGYGTYLGDAFSIGPNFLWAINDKWTLNGAYQVQVAGKSRLAPGNVNLTNYNLHYARLKLGYAF
jgi:hypothetical protein